MPEIEAEEIPHRNAAFFVDMMARSR